MFALNVCLVTGNIHTHTHQKTPPCSSQLLKFITLCSAKFSKENNMHLFLKTWQQSGWSV